MRITGAVAAMSNSGRAFATTEPKASRAFSGDQKIGSQPSAISKACAPRLGPHHREVDGDVRLSGRAMSFNGLPRPVPLPYGMS